jgi:parvulin-like peptidyl-prolyl isomerase
MRSHEGGRAGRTGRWLLVGLGLVGAAALAFSWSRGLAAPTGGGSDKSPPPPTAPEPSSDYSRRVVAYIYGTEKVTREELGEYLIARMGADRLELLVNKRIIEHACRENGIEVSEAEIQAAFAEDLHGMGDIQPGDFVNKVLRQYKKTLYEWKEDVIRPKIAMTKLCQKLNRVHVTDEDLRIAYDAYYGEKVDCLMIMWPLAEKNLVLNQIYGKIRDDEKEFDRAARMQASSQLASKGGRIPPIGHHTTGNDELEKEAFSLKVGDVSRVIETPDGVVVLKCIGRTPPDKNKKLEDVREALHKEVLEKKTQQEIPNLFKDLRKQAEPKLFLQRYQREDDFLREVRKDLQSTGPGKPAESDQAPKGN